MTALEDILRTVRHPARYLGNEINARHDEPAEAVCRVALCFPDLYPVGMSYLGLQVLYGLLNAEPDLIAERVFAPDRDLERELSRRGLRLFSLEHRRPLAEFDLVGFSLQHELHLPEVLAMLAMGGVPMRATDRTREHPLVIAGGPGAGNPEPIAEALDAVVLGDAENVIVPLARAAGLARRRGREREAVLDAIANLPGVYLPNRYRVHYHPSGPIERVTPQGGAPARVRRAVLADLDAVPPPSRPVVPFAECVHDRLTLEIQRGCTRGCRFCQAGMINRPVRTRSAPRLIEAIETGLAGTGFDQVSLLSLSAGDYPELPALLEAFYGFAAPRRVSLSLPSLRAETLTSRLAELVRTVRKSGFTIAPEAGSARLRRVIHKDLGEDDVRAAALGAFRAGWRLIKLYFMLGLPSETEADREAIVALVERLRAEARAEGFRPDFHVTLSLFVPKPHTPFQWEEQLALAPARAARDRVAGRLRRIPGVKVGTSLAEMSWAEGLLARGDRRLFPALAELAEGGQRLCAWSEHFSAQAFERAFGAVPVPGGPDFYLRGRGLDETLPWDHLDFGPRKDFLLAERERAAREEPTPDCARGECSDCGACDPGVAPRLHRAPPAATARADEPGGEAALLRLTLAKEGPAAMLSHLEFMNAIERALRRAGWPLRFSGGFHPRPRLSFGPACPAGAASRCEMVDVSVSGTGDTGDWERRLREQLPAGLTLLECRRLSAQAPGIMRGVGAVRYRLFLPMALQDARQGADRLLARDSWVVQRQSGGGERRVELRPSLQQLTVEPGPPGCQAVLLVRLGDGAGARPLEVAREAFGLDTVEVLREALLPAGPGASTEGGT
jgi:radical SAM family uncharacterized protein/radical SAM-linked protein